MECEGCGAEFEPMFNRQTVSWNNCPYCDRIVSLPIPFSVIQSLEKIPASPEIPVPKPIKADKENKKDIFIILWLIFFFPVGLYKLWNSNWGLAKKMIITSAIGFFILMGYIGELSDTNQFIRIKIKEARQYLAENEIEMAKKAFEQASKKKQDSIKIRNFKKELPTLIADAYIRLAKKEIEKNNFKKAMLLLNKALLEVPGYNPALEYEHIIKKQKKLMN
jgi:tetratricopeptide (TPR) repeat protein